MEVKTITELSLAIDNRQWKEARELLDHHRERLQQLLSGKVFCCFKDKLVNPLHGAIIHGAPMGIVNRLISPFTINMGTIYGQTALLFAVSKKRWDMVPVLLQHGADIKVYDHLHETPLLLAARYGAPTDIITRLVSSHNINRQSGIVDVTALHEVILKERWELVPVLLQHGADVNLTNDVYETSLLLAARFDAPTDIIIQLISPHNINKQSSFGDVTPLHVVTMKERWDLVPVLLQHGADINLCDDLNRTPLHHAAHHDTPTDIFTQLISPSNINMQAKNGYTLLHQAVAGKRWKLVPVLLQYGADPSMLDSPQPDQLLVLSLKCLCISTIRAHMHVMSDEAYEGLGLPRQLVDEVKLRPQAEDIVKRGPLYVKAMKDDFLIRGHCDGKVKLNIMSNVSEQRIL